ncbi:hypothetical protein BN1708_014786 [Verticillium longisporum]|uniref:Uncharacterized protein n=1 Tax=Verticillium longisporum TaxID=100787 RepID=A0A0G4LZD1_VERLO|nr:hypothetical protein BN1708_014786 [Verticillium longisporum]
MTEFKRSSAPSPESVVASDDASSPLDHSLDGRSTRPPSYLLQTYLDTPHPHERRSLGLTGLSSSGPSVPERTDYTPAALQAGLADPLAPRMLQTPVLSGEEGQVFYKEMPSIPPLDIPSEHLPSSPGSIALTPDASHEQPAMQTILDDLRRSLSDVGVDCEKKNISELMAAHRRIRRGDKLEQARTLRVRKKTRKFGAANGSAKK